MKMYQWLHRNIGWSLPILLLLIAIASFLIAKCNSIKLAKEINLGDVISSMLSGITLYFTVVILVKFTDIITKTTKEADVEKGLLIERLREIYLKLSNLNDRIDVAKLDFNECVRDITRMRKVLKEIVEISTSLKSISINQDDLSSLQNKFVVSNNDLKDILTYTPPQSSRASAQISYITISDGEILLDTQGVAAAIAEIDKLKGYITSCILLVNGA